MKTGCHPMRTRLQLYLDWGISFEEPYIIPDRGRRQVIYASRLDLERSIQSKLPQAQQPMKREPTLRTGRR